ncbi:putative thymidylate kinase [Xenohaliotis phage pCXc-HC2016]|nr:putative thymidylate kinase [Xenohaliotis phage pCXc-HC2016]AQW89130.1 putative thymidylate kinase [Xenohaliotis phage pCXc-HR2015]
MRIVSFEGASRVGKTTLIRALERKLRCYGMDNVHVIREMSDPQGIDGLAALVLRYKLDIRIELLLIMALRAEWKDFYLRFKNDAHFFLYDRFIDSTLVYQSNIQRTKTDPEVAGILDIIINNSSCCYCAKHFMQRAFSLLMLENPDPNLAHSQNIINVDDCFLGVVTIPSILKLHKNLLNIYPDCTIFVDVDDEMLMAPAPSGEKQILDRNKKTKAILNGFREIFRKEQEQGGKFLGKERIVHRLKRSIGLSTKERDEEKNRLANEVLYFLIPGAKEKRGDWDSL